MYALLRRRFLCGEVCGEKRKWGGEGGEEKLGKPYFSFGNRFRHARRSFPGLDNEEGEGGREGYLAGSHVCFDIRNSKIY